MIQKHLLEILEARQQRTMATLDAKQAEYARGDRLHNFKQLGIMHGIPPEQALLYLVSKHWQAMLDFANDLAAGRYVPIKQWDEKYGDMIAYMHLLEGLVIEREVMRQKEMKENPEAEKEPEVKTRLREEMTPDARGVTAAQMAKQASAGEVTNV